VVRKTRATEDGRPYKRSWPAAGADEPHHCAGGRMPPLRGRPRTVAPTRATIWSPVQTSIISCRGGCAPPLH